MPVFKCKMCGGDLQIAEKDTVAQCSYCGSQQTLPRLDDDRRANLYDRANHFRRGSDFDKAAAIYESILNEDHTDAEAYWSLVLCKYGVEYVEDPKTHKRIPTCNRAQYTSVFSDADYKQAVANAVGAARALYEAEAKAIDAIQKGILEISAKEEPFDVFVCYKESDNNGRRTPDSVLAQDLYYQLKQEGFKVFFSRITLEDKLGSAYEPYIFAALNSSKVMVAVGTKPEHFNSPWVRNEWSRYLALMKSGAQKTLIPAYKDMDPYDLPEEFSHLQAQDMSKLGFMQDLIRGIKKIVRSEDRQQAAAPAGAVAAGANTQALLKRAFMFLEDGDWEQADEYCEKVLDTDPENARAYLGKLMAEMQVREESALVSCPAPFAEKNNFQKALRFADEKTKKNLQGYNSTIVERLETERKEKIYSSQMSKKRSLQYETDFKAMAESFKSLDGYKDAEAQAAECLHLAEQAREARLRSEEEARIRAEQRRIENERIASERRLEAERKAEIARIAAEKRRAKIKKILKIVLPSAVALIAFLILLNTVIIPASKYSRAQGFVEEKKYSEAVSIYSELGDYKDSKQKLENYRFLALNTGDIFKFGSYEQDNNTSNGTEPVEWRVLAVEGSRVLLISEQCLDCKPYNEEFEAVTWETCTLRGWLNGDFINTAFSAEEQLKIAQTQVENPDNQEYGTDGGAATTDRIILLSTDEANRYFDSDRARISKPTPYAVAQGAYEDYDGNAWWWLRSPGSNDFGAAYVSDGGSVDGYGDLVDHGDLDAAGESAVRPALWLNL